MPPMGAGRHKGLQQRALFVGGEGIVLAARAHGHDAIHPVANESVDDTLALGQIDREVL